MTHGFRDVVVSMHGSASQADPIEFSFAGGEYSMRSCYSASWKDLEGNEVKEPRITAYPSCRNYE
jgi:hypothetical protein